MRRAAGRHEKHFAQAQGVRRVRPDARLEALPWARYTLQEQESMERKQRAGRLIKEDE